MSIVSGLGFGANQNLYTSLGVSIILLVLTLRSSNLVKRKKFLKSINEFNLNFEWEKKNNNISISKIIDLLANSCNHVALIRFDQSDLRRNLVLQIGLMDGFDIQFVLNQLSEFDNDLDVQVSNAAIDF